MVHSHVNMEGNNLVSVAETVLGEAGERWTSMRSKVYEALVQIDKPVSAYEIADIISRSENRRIAPNSVYRILDLFENRNLVRRIESTSAYVVNAHPECSHNCVYLPCDRCGGVIHVDDDKLALQFRTLAQASGFRPTRPVLEMHGECAACA